MNAHSRAPTEGAETETLSDRVRRLIEERDAGNKSAAARRCGINQPAMSRLANGATSPDLDTVRAIAQGYGVSLDWLVTGGGPQQADGAGAAPDDMGYGDSPADELVHWLELAETKRQIPELGKRIKRAYRLATDRGFQPEDYAVLDAWRDRETRANPPVDDAKA
jgi:transcriptional regulator with XRE-family HTH domain